MKISTKLKFANFVISNPFGTLERNAIHLWSDIHIGVHQKGGRRQSGNRSTKTQIILGRDHERVNVPRAREIHSRSSSGIERGVGAGGVRGGGRRNQSFTFSISSIQASKSMPKSMNCQTMPSFLYSSCSSTNM